ncbi:zeatin O-glucosyltransferase-like [Dorcoceras hygrometricum]|uniref:Glycosyltransferase n=1 Tax=Dorcoceras hygrometricum TaxID=472368 RepID=A0A2Z7A486_9LAMI|nr:zeatin O-glucosyltransferase-like [Dorcoceras hygrometricum]
MAAAVGGSLPEHGCQENDIERHQVVVVMLPLPAQGHLNQLLHLSRLIAAYNIPVYYVSTATHNRQAKLRVHGWDPLSTSNPLFNSVSQLRQPFAALVRSLSRIAANRIVIIHDSMMSSVVQDFVSIPKAESYVFHSVSAFAIFCFFREEAEKSTINTVPLNEKILQELQIPSLEDCFTEEFMELIAREHEYIALTSGSLYNSSRVFEGEFMGFIKKLSEEQNKKHWAIGPFNPMNFTTKNEDGSRHESLKWLDKQPPESVVLISFGTTISLPDEQIKNLATGLEESEVKFIWVFRDADRGENSAAGDQDRRAELPEHFEERVKERGIILRDWAPQLEILNHSATGGFLSHCGWNSCMESISMGVPVAAWPMHSDQPRNTVLITKVLKIGIVVKDWARRHEVVDAEAISMALRRLMNSEEGKEMRRRAAELSRVVRRSVEEGGVTRLELDSFIAHVRR